MPIGRPFVARPIGILSPGTSDGQSSSAVLEYTCISAGVAVVGW